MSDRQEDKQIRDAFLKSRAWAILRCAEIMADSGRKDLARQILSATNIDRQRLFELKLQST
jgi:very-short-patch-repair endonuclease